MLPPELLTPPQPITADSAEQAEHRVVYQFAATLSVRVL
jgi:hypothetical protein